MYPSLVTVDSPIVRAILPASEVMLGHAVENLFAGQLNQAISIHAAYRPPISAPANVADTAHTDFDMALVRRGCGARLRVHDVLDIT